MLYRENGQFKTTYRADQQVFPILQDRIFIGLVLAGGTMWALLHLFGADASKPLSAAALELARLAVA